MTWQESAIAGAGAVMAIGLFHYMRGMFVAWRADIKNRRLFTFRTIGGDVGRLVGAMAGNPWGGVLVTDRPLTDEELAILRAAVERYRARCSLLPIDGQVFELKDGEIVKW